LALQTVLLLVVAAVLITAGATQITRSRKRSRTQRRRDQIGYLFIALGALIGFIAFVGMALPG
jgi:hypothetical protein